MLKRNGKREKERKACTISKKILVLMPFISTVEEEEEEDHQLTILVMMIIMMVRRWNCEMIRRNDVVVK